MSHYDYAEEKIPFSPETRRELKYKRKKSEQTVWPKIATGMVRITVEGYVPSESRVVTNVFSIDASRTDEIANNTRYLAKLLHDQMKAPSAPEWKPGDVVLYQFSRDGQAYTYVIEGVDPWRISGTRTLTRCRINSAWSDHRVALVMRQGRPVEMGPDYCTEGVNCALNHTTLHE